VKECWSSKVTPSPCCTSSSCGTQDCVAPIHWVDLIIELHPITTVPITVHYAAPFHHCCTHHQQATAISSRFYTSMPIIMLYHSATTCCIQYVAPYCTLLPTAVIVFINAFIIHAASIQVCCILKYCPSLLCCTLQHCQETELAACYGLQPSKAASCSNPSNQAQSLTHLSSTTSWQHCLPISLIATQSPFLTAQYVHPPLL